MKTYFYTGTVIDDIKNTYSLSGLITADNAIEAWELLKNTTCKNTSLNQPIQINLTKFEVVE